MNKYIIPVCDIQAGNVGIRVISANSLSDCQDKLMNQLIDEYDCLHECFEYQEFVELADKNDILVGSITDIEVI